MDQKLKDEMGLAAEKNIAVPKKTEFPKRNNRMAMIAYIVFFLPLLTEDKNDPFVKFHVKQGMILFVASMLLSVVATLPLVGPLFSPFASIAIVAFMVIGMRGALKGEQKPLPIIGKYADSIKI